MPTILPSPGGLKRAAFLILFSAAASYCQTPADIRPAPVADTSVLILSEKRVTGSRTIMDESQAEQTVFASDVKRLPLIDNDVFRAVQTHPGVSSDEFSARFSVRGGDRDETLVVLDGMELFSPFHLQDYGGALSVLDMLAVSKAELYPGGFSSEYGDRMSAVLDVKTRDPSEKLGMDAGVDLLNAHYFVSRQPVFASVRAGYIGLLMMQMQSDEIFEPHYGDALVRIDHKRTPGESLSSYALYAGDLNKMDKEGRQDDVDSEIHNGMTWARYEKALTDGLRLSVFPYGGLYKQERYLGGGDRDHRDLTQAGLKSSLEIDMENGHRLMTGAELRWMRGVYDYVQRDSSIRINTDKQGAVVKGFLSHTWHMTPSASGGFGLRLLYHPADVRTDIGPHLAVMLSPARTLSFRAAWGLYYQPVDPLHLPVETGTAETMESEQAVHWVLGGRWSLPKQRMQLRLEGYLKQYSRLAGFIRDFGKSSRRYLPRDKGAAYGIETTVDKGFGPIQVHAGYTWSISEVSNAGHTFYSEDDTRHALNTGLSYAPNEKWSAYLELIFHTGIPYTERDAAGVFQAPNAGRLPAYHSASTRISRTWQMKSTSIQAYLQVLNLYNQDNAHEYSWTEEPDGSGQTVYVRKKETLIPFLPSIGVNVSF